MMRPKRYRKKSWREKVALSKLGAEMLRGLVYRISALALCAGLLVGVIVMAAIDRWII